MASMPCQLRCALPRHGSKSMTTCVLHATWCVAQMSNFLVPESMCHIVLHRVLWAQAIIVLLLSTSCLLKSC